MKRILTIIILSTVGCLHLMAQSGSMVHVVRQGETLKSIAIQHGITEAQIIEINPDATQHIYIGMGLVIPAPDKTIDDTKPSNIKPTDSIQSSIPQQVSSIYDRLEYERLEKDNDYNYHFLPFIEVAFPFFYTEKALNTAQSRSWFGNNQSNSSSEPTSFAVSLGFNYYFKESLNGPYAGARIEWAEYISKSNRTENGDIIKVEKKTQNITLPIEIGYSFPIPTKNLLLGISPFATIDTNIAIKGTIKTEEEKKKTKVGGAFTFYSRIGIRFRINIITIGGFYAFPLNDKFKDIASKKPFPGITFGVGF